MVKSNVHPEDGGGAWSALNQSIDVLEIGVYFYTPPKSSRLKRSKIEDENFQHFIYAIW